MKKLTEKSGFTLIETLMALAIFSVGILALFAMQTAAIKENKAANRITTATNWAQERVEVLLATKYENLTDGTGANDGCGGLGNWPNSDGTSIEKNNYTIYWNVANNCTMTKLNEYFDDSPVKEQQMLKHIRVIVTQEIGGSEKVYAVFNYIKQNV